MTLDRRIRAWVKDYVAEELTAYDIGGRISAIKTADEVVNNSDVYQTDDHIRNLATEANTRYSFYMFIHYSSGAVADIKLHLYHTKNDWTAHGFYDLDGMSSVGETSVGHYIEWILGAAGNDKYCNFRGEFKTVTSGALNLEWAQNTADASDTTLHEGCYLIVQKMQ